MILSERNSLITFGDLKVYFISLIGGDLISSYEASDITLTKQFRDNDTWLLKAAELINKQVSITVHAADANIKQGALIITYRGILSKIVMPEWDAGSGEPATIKLLFTDLNYSLV